MNPTTPEEPENGGQDTAPRKRSLEIKPEYKQMPPPLPGGHPCHCGSGSRRGPCNRLLHPKGKLHAHTGVVWNTELARFA